MGKAGERLIVGLALGAVAALYSVPFLAVSLQVAPQGLVALLDADTYLYAVIARESVGASGFLENPWYGTRIALEESTYLRFGKAIAAYGLLERAVGVPMALPFWSAGCTVLLGLAAYALARRVLALSPVASTVVVLFLTLVNLGYDRHDFAALWQGLGQGAYHYGLPFRRPFFPQVGAIVVMAYLALMPAALSSGAARSYAALGAVQFAGVLTFPYATALCAVTTALSIVFMKARGVPVRIRPALVFGVACALADLAYVASGPALQGLGTSGEALWQWDPTWLSLQGMYGLVAIGAAVALLVRTPAPPARFALLAFASSVVLLALSDALLLTLQIGHHARYFGPLATSLLCVLFAMEAARRWPQVPWRAVHGALAGVVLAWGLAQALATYRYWQPINEANRLLAAKLREMRLERGDLVVEPVPAFLSARRPPYWESSPVPLASPARTLLTSGARFLLAPADIGLHLDREAVYLFLAGHDERSLRALLAPVDPPALHQYFLAGYGREFPLVGSRRAEILATVEREMAQRLRRLEEGADLLPAARRIVVADLAANPTFRPERLDQLFVFTPPVATIGPWVVREGRARERQATARNVATTPSSSAAANQ